MITVYQLPHTVDREVRLSVTCDYFDTEVWMNNVTVAARSGLYTEIATIKTDDLDEAFEIGNFMGDASRIRISDDRMHSVSVGDLLETRDGSVFVVAPCGFTLIN